MRPWLCKPLTFVWSAWSPTSLTSPFLLSCLFPVPAAFSPLWALPSSTHYQSYIHRLLGSFTHIGLQRQKVRRWYFLEIVHVFSKSSSYPGPWWSASLQLLCGLALQPGHHNSRSSPLPKVALREGAKAPERAFSFAFVLFLKIKLWLGSQISL